MINRRDEDKGGDKGKVRWLIIQERHNGTIRPLTLAWDRGYRRQWGEKKERQATPGHVEAPWAGGCAFNGDE